MSFLSWLLMCKLCFMLIIDIIACYPVYALYCRITKLQASQRRSVPTGHPDGFVSWSMWKIGKSQGFPRMINHCPMGPMCFTCFTLQLHVWGDSQFLGLNMVEPKSQQRPFRLLGHVEESRQLAVPKTLRLRSRPTFQIATGLSFILKNACSKQTWLKNPQTKILYHLVI